MSCLQEFKYSKYIINIPKDRLTVIYVGKKGVDYVFTGLFVIANSMKRSGIKVSYDELYKEMLEYLDIATIATAELYKGKINIVLNITYLNDAINQPFWEYFSSKSDKLNVLVDFSSPNIAKDMHVGHLRSTIIGENICRLFELQGHNVHRVNHVGDWGLPFGMIIQYMYEQIPNFETKALDISDLQEFYAASKRRFNEDNDFKSKSHERVVELQSGNAETIQAWEYLKHISRLSYNEIYNRLNVSLEEVGESFYQPMIQETIGDLQNKGLVTKEDGRLIINVPGFNFPLTLVKSNGGYTYDTTDLAALRYRLTDLQVDNIYYVVGSAQEEHFKLIFKVAEMAGWKQEHQLLQYVGFGLILNSDGKPFKSRDGNTEKLVDLLDNSLDKAKTVLESKRQQKISVAKSKVVSLSDRDMTNIIRSVGYSAIKYYDLSTSRLKDYEFSYDNMLSLNGNTAVYLLYAYVRISGILRKVKKYVNQRAVDEVLVSIENKYEQKLAVELLRFTEVLDMVKDRMMFHGLCGYMYTLSNTFHEFFTKCRCINFDNNGTVFKDANMSRLKLCQITKSVFEKGFYLLNIEPLDRM